MLVVLRRSRIRRSSAGSHMYDDMRVDRELRCCYYVITRYEVFGMEWWGLTAWFVEECY